MAEPQPSDVREGDNGSESIPASGAAEDRKAAAAMSSLDTHGEGETSSAPKQEVDSTALGDAMKRLEVADPSSTDDAKKAPEKTAAEKEREEKERKWKEEEERRRKIKVDQADVTLLVEQLDLSKAKATELLKAHDADAVKAMTAWVSASA